MARPDDLITETEAAQVLCLSVRTLQAWRVRGGGPPFVKLGRTVRYRRADLITLIQSNTVRSTSERI